MKKLLILLLLAFGFIGLTHGDSAQLSDKFLDLFSPSQENLDTSQPSQNKVSNNYKWLMPSLSHGDLIIISSNTLGKDDDDLIKALLNRKELERIKDSFGHNYILKLAVTLEIKNYQEIHETYYDYSNNNESLDETIKIQEILIDTLIDDILKHPIAKAAEVAKEKSKQKVIAKEKSKEKAFIEAAIQKELENAIALEAVKEKELADELAAKKNKQKEIVEAQAALAKQLSFSSDTFCDHSPNIKVSNGLFYFQNQEKPYSGKNLCSYKNGNQYSQGDINKGLRVGTWIYSYQNGKKKSEIQYVDGERHGTRTDWYEQGQIKSTAIYKAGKQHGSQVAWHPNGRKMAETNFVNDKEDGAFLAWHDNGQIQLKSYFEDGKEDGSFNLYDKSGNKLVEGQYFDGEKDGVWKEWIERDGDMVPKTNVTYFNGIKNGLETNYFFESFDDDYCSYGYKQSEGYYKNGKKDGPWKEWAEVGNERVTRDDGSFWFWSCYDNQNIVADGKYENGLKVGQWIEGDLMGSYVNGKRHNIWTEYEYLRTDYLGDIVATYSYNLGVKDGLFNTFNTNTINEAKLSEGRYKNDKKDGVWTTWYEAERCYSTCDKDIQAGKSIALAKAKYIGDYVHQKKSEINYKNGEKNGVEIEWGMRDDLSGYKIHQTNYKNGRKDGLYIKYFTDDINNKQIKGYYQLGKKHGIWLEYHWDGELSRAQCYQNDEKTKLTTCQNSEPELNTQEDSFSIVVAPFEFVGDAYHGTEVENIFRNNLNLSIIDNLNLSGKFNAINVPKTVKNNIGFNYWKQQKIDVIVFGKVEIEGKIITIDIYIFDINSQNQLYAKRIAIGKSASEADVIKVIADLLSDIITNVLELS